MDHPFSIFPFERAAKVNVATISLNVDPTGRLLSAYDLDIRQKKDFLRSFVYSYDLCFGEKFCLKYSCLLKHAF